MNKLPYLETTVKWINNNKRVNLPRSFCENWHRVDPHLSWVTHHERAFFSLSTKHQNHMKVHTMPNPKRSKLCLLNSVSSSDDTSSSLRSRCWSWRWTVFCVPPFRLQSTAKQSTAGNSTLEETLWLWEFFHVPLSCQTVSLQVR